ncbi:MAG: hypothetical protein HOU81_02680 [Hamadaea sp.]|uniref:EF-hand domain-containing protein n=1 Tax=Hamadaea sp. TaxID=2024425 RepID=UPI00184F5CDB|nr:hypothetical protein [Hamadaea sp.]NUR69700.1 hypothetical protein [Hamadaea sp.]NUT19568.1 hypothetical protein [Hamadaea sp.]
MEKTPLSPKLDAAFDQIDTARRGTIDRAAILQQAGRVLGAFGQETSTARGRETVSLYGWYWDCLCSQAGVSRDGRMTREEFGAAFQGAFIDGEKFAAVYTPMALATIRLADGDNDGYLAPAELARLWRAIGSSVDDITGAFTAVDTDGDGLLSVLEVLDAIRDFYTSDDPDSPGNLLYRQVAPTA